MINLVCVCSQVYLPNRNSGNDDDGELVHEPSAYLMYHQVCKYFVTESARIGHVGTCKIIYFFKICSSYHNLYELFILMQKITTNVAFNGHYSNIYTNTIYGFFMLVYFHGFFKN